ncbi:MAG: RNA polymerase sigma factor [Archangium sp.]|nr:RNA polymerase sigma factor [Archangium sp.]
MNDVEFEAQVPPHLPALRSLARRLVGNRDDADDIVQETLLRASRSLVRFRGESSLKTWLFSIASRVAIDHLRSTRRWDSQVMVDACDERGRDSVMAKYADPSVVFDVEQHIAFCFTCIGRSLDPEQHAALVLSEFFELKNDDAAGVLGLTEPQLRHALAQARAEMKAQYEGLCALVNKDGACYQCRVLREVAPPAQQGPALPATPLSFEARVSQVKAAGTAGVDQRLNDFFFAVTRQLQAARGE